MLLSQNGRKGIFWIWGCGLLLLSGCQSIQIAGDKAPPSKLENPYFLNKAKIEYPIAFLAKDKQGNAFLMVMGEKGEEPAYVIDEPVAPVQPRWNPKNGKLAFFSSYHYSHQELFSIEPDGTGRDWLSIGTTKGISRDADWGPEGDEILYLSDGTDRMEIYLLDITTQRSVRLTQSPLFQRISDPRMSPDGQMITFTLWDKDDHSANIAYFKNGFGEDTFLFTKAGPLVHYHDPRWSPDGKWLLAVTDRFGAEEIVRLDAATSWEQRLTYSNGVGKSLDPRVSPDGKWICYSSDRFDGAGVYRMDPEGHQDTRLTPPELRASQPVWTPDSKTVVFVGVDQAGNCELYRVSAEGGNLFKLTESPDLVKSNPEVRGAKW